MTNKENNKKMIEVNDVDKSFKIVDEGVENLKGVFTNPLKLFHSKTRVFEALADVTFSVNQGDFVGIIGRNGSGKSTLLKLIAGIYRPDKGEIKVNGKIVPFLELGVGFNPNLTARENVYLNGTILGMSHKYLKNKFNEIIEFAELQEFVDTEVKKFSSGMQVRLAFSIAIQAQADIYLLDEVLAVGDINFQLKCADVLKEFIKRGKTILYVSHDMSSIEKYCNKVAFMNKGRLVDIGVPEPVISKYKLLLADLRRHELHNSEKGVEDQSSTDSPVQIHNVKIKGREKESSEISFTRGDDVEIEISYTINQQVEELNFGVGIFDDQKRLQIAGNNTLDDHFKLNSNLGTQKLVIKFPNVQLHKGKFVAGVSVFGAIPLDIYDQKYSSDTFEFNSGENRGGVVHLDHKWIK